MLWNKEFCFLHYPKTAGKSLTRYFVQAWDKPIEGFISPGQVNELADCGLEETNIKIGRGHENLNEAKTLIDESEYSFSDIKAVFVCIRNPYDLMVSNYHFMRKTYKNNKDKQNFQIANENNFTDFCEKVGMSSPSRWMELDGKQPDNLRIIRFEQLENDLASYAEEFGFEHIPLARLNASKHDTYQSYMSEAAELSIHRKFKYIFDQGYYQRETFSQTPLLATARDAA